MDAETLTTISGLAGATKATLEAVQAIVTKTKGNKEAEKAAAEALGLVTDLQSRLFQLQEVAFRLQEENRQLREDILEKKERLAERERYQGQQMGHSLLLVREDQPSIFYCPTCLETKGTAISLQPRFANWGGGSAPVGYHCNVCDTTFPV